MISALQMWGKEDNDDISGNKYWEKKENQPNMSDSASAGLYLIYSIQHTGSK
jgi:hypothetical protein